jgi:hypothetical protein
LGYIGEACFSSVDLTKFAIFGKKLQKHYPKQMKNKIKWESHVLFGSK